MASAETPSARAQQVKGQCNLTLEQEVLDGMICPITSSMMTDPVCCVDGHSYERKAIESWFTEGNLLSPSTGLPLHSRAIIPNHALRRAIQDLVNRKPALTFLQLPFCPSAPSADPPARLTHEVRRFDITTKGGSLQLSESNTIASRTSTPSTFPEVLAFVDGHLRTIADDLPGLCVEILSTVTAFSGPIFGLTDRDPRGWRRDIAELVNDNSWYLSESGWLHSPLSAARMSGWTPGNAKAGDTISFHVTASGNIQIHVNGNKVSDVPLEVPLAEADGRVRNFWGFVALTGVATSVRLRTTFAYDMAV